MNIQRRETRDGYYYSFTYRDKNGKLVRLKKDQHPHFTDRKKAETWMRSQEAYIESRKNLIAKKLDWKSRYYEFGPLVEKFTKYQKKQAPNSWKTSVAYFEQYALHWFLNIKHQNNINGWPFLYQEFIDWLHDEARTSRDTKLSLGSANQIIHALNSFIECLSKYGDIDPAVVRKCTHFPKHEMKNEKGLDDLIPEDDFVRLHRKLNTVHRPTADFFYVLYHTGMRFNECWSLPMNCLYSGEIGSSVLADELADKNIEYFGYIVLSSQAAHKFRKRNEHGEIERKPLKSRKRIHASNDRTIPIMDKECWNILARRYKECSKELKKKTHGTDKVNYLLFEDVGYSKSKRELKKVYESFHMEPKGWHAARHSFCTFFVGKTRSFLLARAILGHRSAAFERYLHIYEDISRKALQGSQEIDEVI